jgi:hypothetical protein
MAHRRAAWDGLGGLAADVALVQEAGRPDQEWRSLWRRTTPTDGRRLALEAVFRGGPRLPACATGWSCAREPH